MREGDYPTEILDVRIKKLNHNGIGKATYQHPAKRPGNMGKKLTIYVPNTVPGDVVRVTVPNAKGRRTATISYDELLEASSDRNRSLSITDAVTGGTPLVFMNYDAQLAFKEKEVKMHLKNSEINDVPVNPIIGMENPNRYRNKMDLTFGANGELGMHEQGNYLKVIDMEDSLIAPEIMIEAKKVISQWQQDHELPGFNKDTQEGLLRKVLMRYSFTTKEFMIVIYAKQAPNTLQAEVDDLTNRLISEFETLGSLQWVLNTDRSEQVVVDETFILHGKEYINDRINGFDYQVWPGTFFQANPVQASVMVQTALEMAEVDSTYSVLDLFCGVGTFSLPFAKKAKELIGIEIVGDSILSARKNAEIAGLDNTTFFASDARKGLEKLKQEWPTPDLLILNPPRSGAGGKLMRSIGRYGSKQVLYISCNPKTLAPDLRWLKDFGYEVKKIQPIDQFPHTMHVETVALLSKLNTENYLDIEIGEDELSEIDFSKEATYGEIKKYVLDKYGLKVSSLYIEQVKRKYGLIERENYNISKKENQRVPNYPEEKEKAIENALEYFGMIKKIMPQIRF